MICVYDMSQLFYDSIAIFPSPGSFFLGDTPWFMLVTTFPRHEVLIFRGTRKRSTYSYRAFLLTPALALPYPHTASHNSPLRRQDCFTEARYVHVEMAELIKLRQRQEQ